MASRKSVVSFAIMTGGVRSLMVTVAVHWSVN